jgi:hypothetical protein
LQESDNMEQETGKEPKALPDEALDDAAGGLQAADHTGGANLADITDGTSNAGFKGGVYVGSDAVVAKPGDGSVKPGG